MDDLLLLRGNQYCISQHIRINNPTLGQICEYGEEEYWGLLAELCATSYDYRLMLDEAGVDYLDIDDWTMFRTTCGGLKPASTKILIPDLDFSSLVAMRSNETDRVVLVNKKGEIVLDEFIYQLMVDYIRNVHGLKRNFEIPGNKAARDVFMWEAREARNNAGRKPFKSTLAPLVSAVCNSAGFKYDYETVWNLNIYAFMDAVKRIQKIKQVDAFTAGMYSGWMDTSKINKGQLRKLTNWLDEIT